MANRWLLLGLVLAPALTLRTINKVHPWPCKNGNSKRTGQGEHSGAGATDLSRAAWVFEAGEDSFYQSPVVDADRNAYFSGTSGRLYSMAPGGSVNWVMQLRKEDRHGGQMPTPVLLGDNLYMVDGQGWLVAIDMASGKEVWRKQYAYVSGDDSWSMGLDERTGTLFAVGFPTPEKGDCIYGGSHMYALSVLDGQTKWTYRMKACNCNIMPSVINDMVLFSDQIGNAYALNIATGEQKWSVPGTNNTFTTGTAAIGENGLMFVASNLGPSRGVIRAFTVSDGVKKWEREFDREANNAPAVFRDKRGRLLVVMGVSNNPGLPNPVLDGRIFFRGTVFALDAETGRTSWEFSPPVWTKSSCAGSTPRKICLPDAFTNPSVDAHGKVYIGWMGGKVFSIDGSTGEELGQWETRSGMQGAPGIADGVLVVTSCQRMAGFVDKARKR